MSLIVKIMSAENLPDEDSRKSYNLLTGVTFVEFHRKGGNAYIGVTTETVPEVQSYCVDANVYVMNENGKTISAYCAEAVEDPMNVVVKYNGTRVVTGLAAGPTPVVKLRNALGVPAFHTFGSVSPDCGTELYPSVEGMGFLVEGNEYISFQP